MCESMLKTVRERRKMGRAPTRISDPYTSREKYTKYKVIEFPLATPRAKASDITKHLSTPPLPTTQIVNLMLIKNFSF